MPSQHGWLGWDSQGQSLKHADKLRGVHLALTDVVGVSTPAPLIPRQADVATGAVCHHTTPRGAPHRYWGCTPRVREGIVCPGEATLKQWDEAANCPESFTALHFEEEAGRGKQWD